MNSIILGGLDPEKVLSVLEEAAEAAARHTLPRFRTAMNIDNKWTTGFDPVTDADREAEVAVREVIARHFPDHGIVGEEWDAKTSSTAFEWIVDPIDGTRAFICGVPVWGTLIGLCVNGEAVAGLMAQPFTGETYAALPGKAWYSRGGETLPLRTSSVTSLAKARLTSTSADLFNTPELSSQWRAVNAAALSVRYGLDCYGYCLLAAGHIDVVVEAGLKNVDIAPLVALIRNAGGTITTWDGHPPESGGNILASATPELHAEVTALLSSAAA